MSSKSVVLLSQPHSDSIFYFLKTVTFLNVISLFVNYLFIYLDGKSNTPCFIYNMLGGGMNRGIKEGSGRNEKYSDYLTPREVNEGRR